ncbi:MAG: hypothetical protein NTZ64_05665 [Polaromonas sp.]|nr:hypothetical protein [Polaromonas sp.]
MAGRQSTQQIEKSFISLADVKHAPENKHGPDTFSGEDGALSARQQRGTSKNIKTVR